MSELENQFGRTLVVVAHPDDEVIGCGLLLQRLRHATVAFLTDGAPADRYFWGKFGSRRAYAELRAKETQDALAGLRGLKTLRFGVRDQELMFHLDAALKWLRKTVKEEKPRSIVTHAYEGGHPDHDCCSFLCAVMERESGVPVWEMPMYCRAGGKLVRQQPLENAAATLNVNASDGEERRKREMIAAYQSQDEFISSFDMATERFFLQPRHDYSRPPHRGKLNYECWGWEVTGNDLCAAFGRLMSEGQMKRAQIA